MLVVVDGKVMRGFDYAGSGSFEEVFFLQWRRRVKHRELVVRIGAIFSCQHDKM